MGHHKGKMFVKGQEAWNKAVPVDLECLQCSKSFQVQPHRKVAKFCSIPCARKGSERIKKGFVKTCGMCLGEFYTPKSHGARIFCSKSCASVASAGRKPGNYIEDRSKLKRHDRRNDSAYNNWRKEVWLRDNFKCKIANPDCAGRIEAHHILGWSKYPELRYQVNNGITLCHHHHPRSRVLEVELSPYFQGIVDKVKF